MPGYDITKGSGIDFTDANLEGLNVDRSVEEPSLNSKSRKKMSKVWLETFGWNSGSIEVSKYSKTIEVPKIAADSKSNQIKTWRQKAKDILNTKIF